MTTDYNFWPRPVRVQLQIPLLTDRPPFAGGLEAEDRRWKERLVRHILRGQIRLPGIDDPISTQARKAIDEVTHRVYHIARMTQCRFPILEAPTAPADMAAHVDVYRVLLRTVLLRELVELDGEQEQGIDLVDPARQREVEQFIPPSTRQALYFGLLSVARDYCLPEEPRCGECPIHQICSSYRDDLIEQAQERPLTHIDLFSGAGGFGQGVEQAGYRTLLAADNNEKAIRTYRFNHPAVPESNVLAVDLEDINVEQIRERLERWAEQLVEGKVDVITAGIPCQGFSTAGYRTRPDAEYDVLQDPRNHLYQVVISWTESLQPKYVVIENVPGMKSAGEDEDNILQSVQNSFNEIGYSANFGVINAADFGVAQKRRRLILIASHPDAIPATVDELYHALSVQDGHHHAQRRNLTDTIGDLPAIEADAGAWYMLHNGQVITGHKARYNNEDDLQIYAAMEPGERYIDFMTRRRDIIEARRNAGRTVYSTRSFADKYHKLVPDKPSRTIVAHLKRDGNGYIHPQQVRSITPREAARIQGFDDDFIFLGSQGAQFVQIGNAVPPPLARAVAQLLAQKCIAGRRARAQAIT